MEEVLDVLSSFGLAFNVETRGVRGGGRVGGSCDGVVTISVHFNVDTNGRLIRGALVISFHPLTAFQDISYCLLLPCFNFSFSDGDGGDDAGADAKGDIQKTKG